MVAGRMDPSAYQSGGVLLRCPWQVLPVPRAGAAGPAALAARPVTSLDPCARAAGTRSHGRHSSRRVLGVRKCSTTADALRLAQVGRACCLTSRLALWPPSP